eukprot:2471165-Alexandrium_andersonii.AAC.1
MGLHEKKQSQPQNETYCLFIPNPIWLQEDHPKAASNLGILFEERDHLKAPIGHPWAPESLS